MNVELLRKIQEHNTAHPEQLDMGKWFSSTPCGTTACIAGHACQLSGKSADDWFVQEKAQRLLELTDDQAMLLFRLLEWPGQFRKPLEQSRPSQPEYAAAVNAFIDHFIATGGAE